MFAKATHNLHIWDVHYVCRYVGILHMEIYTCMWVYYVCRYGMLHEQNKNGDKK